MTIGRWRGDRSTPLPGVRNCTLAATYALIGSQLLIGATIADAGLFSFIFHRNNTAVDAMKAGGLLSFAIALKNLMGAAWFFGRRPKWLVLAPRNGIFLRGVSLFPVLLLLCMPAVQSNVDERTQIATFAVCILILACKAGLVLAQAARFADGGGDRKLSRQMTGAALAGMVGIAFSAATAALSLSQASPLIDTQTAIIHSGALLCLSAAAAMVIAARHRLRSAIWKIVRGSLRLYRLPVNHWCDTANREPYGEEPPGAGTFSQLATSRGSR